MSEEEIRQKVEDLVKSQSEELMRIIEEEEEREEKRNEQLNKITDKGEKEKVDYEFGILRARASEKIKKLAKKHDKNVLVLEKKLRGVR